MVRSIFKRFGNAGLASSGGQDTFIEALNKVQAWGLPEQWLPTPSSDHHHSHPEDKVILLDAWLENQQP